VCVALALVGVLPFAAALVVRSAWARAWAAQKSEELLRQQGVVAAYAPSIHVWPLAVELAHMRVESSDGGPAALACERVRVRPKLFALLAGKLAVDQVELDQPKLRLVLRGGEVANLALPKTNDPAHKGPVRSPLQTLALTDASLDIDVDDVHVLARAVDLDVTAEDDPAGASFETAFRAGRAEVHRPRSREDGTVANDDDSLCSIEGRVRIEPETILVRRLDGIGSADLDATPGASPPCDLPATDKRRVELSLGHLRVTLPDGRSPATPEPGRNGRDSLAVDGHVHVRAPIALAERVASLPETDGWIGVDADVRYGPDTTLPEVSGTVEAHDVRLLQYSFAHDFFSEINVRRNIVQSPKTTLGMANGVVTLTDTVVDPLAPGARIEKTRLDATNVDFTALMRDLGVHEHSYVGWDVRELHVPLLSGTLFPLKLDGEFSTKTSGFGVYDRPAEDRTRERLVGFSQADVTAHLAVRPDSIQFQAVRAQLPHSHIDGGFVLLGFHNELRVDAPHVSADLDDLSPIGPVAMHGKVEASARLGGIFNRPSVEGDIQSIAGFAITDMAFGDVSSGHVKVDVMVPEVEITGVRGRRRESAYEVPTATLHFGGSRGLTVDVVGQSAAFGMRDMLSMFALDDDPRFDGIDGKIATRADVHVALGGPEDACGGGFLTVDAKSHLTDVFLYGERFARGEADIALRWYDRQQGIAGADLDVRSFVLDKVQPRQGTRAAAIGTVLGSASIRRGGALAGNVMIDGVPLSRVDALGAFGQQVEGAVSGVAHVKGNLDDTRPDAGFDARVELDVAGTRLRESALPGSHLDVGLTHRLTQTKSTGARTRCGAPVSAPFDKAAYLADTSSHGEWTVNGDLLGGTLLVRDLIATRAKSQVVSGRVSLRGVDLAPLARAAAVDKSDGDQPIAAPASSTVSGQLWGELIVDQAPLDRLAATRARFFLGPTVLSRAGQTLTLKPPTTPITLADDSVTTPPLEVTLATTDGFRGGFVVSGHVARATSDPTLAIEARLDPVDLAVLKRVVPRIDTARGQVDGSLRVTGRAAAPVIAGELHARGEEIEVHGLPSAVTDVHVDVTAASGELTAKGRGKFAGGDIKFEGVVPVRGVELGALESRVVVTGVHLSPADGISATVDADLQVTYDPKANGAAGAGALPKIAGEVGINSFAYTRPISLTTDLSALGTRARRTEVNAYDPSLDFVTLDLHLSARSPLVIKNNLVEVQLAVDSGSLDVTGTNQRVGLRGALRTLPGGRFHFQQSDFDVRQGLIRFDDPTRIAPNVDITAITEYRRYSDTGAAGAGAAGAGAGGGPSAASAGSTRGGALWRITLHAFGDADDLRVDMTSEPSLSQEDIVLLLAVGMTRAELDQLQASSIGASIALNYLGAASGADRAVKKALPIIDDFRFGSAYSTATGKTEPQLTVGKRLTNDLRASVTAGLSEDRELRSNIEWRLNNRLSVQGSYDNINDVSSSALGNLGLDLRWRLEFE
jgi:translocation and assembly module TamB